MNLLINPGNEAPAKEQLWILSLSVEGIYIDTGVLTRIPILFKDLPKLVSASEALLVFLSSVGHFRASNAEVRRLDAFDFLATNHVL